MKKLSGNTRAISFLVITIKAVVALTAATILLGFAQVNNALHPPDAGKKLFNAANEPRYLWLEENAPHLAIYLDNPRRYQRRLIGFFDEWLLGK